jgi:hypothetical protein
MVTAYGHVGTYATSPHPYLPPGARSHGKLRRMLTRHRDRSRVSNFRFVVHLELKPAHTHTSHDRILQCADLKSLLRTERTLRSLAHTPSRSPRIYHIVIDVGRHAKPTCLRVPEPIIKPSSAKTLSTGGGFSGGMTADSGGTAVAAS